MRTLRTEVNSKPRTPSLQNPSRIPGTGSSSSGTTALVTSLVDMSGTVVPVQHKFSSQRNNNTNNTNNKASRMNTEEQQKQQQQHPTIDTISYLEEATSSHHLYFPFRRRARTESSDNGFSMKEGHGSENSCNAKATGPKSCSQHINSSSSSSSSSSLLRFRERFHRWHMFNNNHQQAPDRPKTEISSDANTLDSIRTSNTFYRPSNTTTTTTGINDRSSFLSLGRFSSRWSMTHHTTAAPTATDVSRDSIASTSGRVGAVKEQRDTTLLSLPSATLDGINSSTTTTDATATATATLSAAGCPTNRFFATKSHDSTIHVLDLEIALDKSGTQMGLYTGTLNMETKTPHGQGKMIYYFPTPRTSHQDITIETGDDAVLQTIPEQQQQQHEQEMSERAPVLIYDGQWQNGDWCGFGTLMDLRHGHTYEGGFFDNYKHGLGVLQYADGRVYDGIFAFGTLEGKGHLEYPDGTTYWGHWTSDGIEHGRGKMVFADGRVFDGEFDNGVLHGHGKMTFADGSWYLGEWIDGEPNGLGIQVLPNGILKFEGTFIHGSPIEGSSVPKYHKKSDGDFLCYRSSLAKHGTLVGNIPKHVRMRDVPLKLAN
jgi:hypothetical protein